MAFTHGKNARLWIDQWELTSYFNEFTMAAKAGVADATVFGKGAKSYIGGLKEGTISAKGFYDAGASANDQELAQALGRQTNMNVSLTPTGKTAAGTRGIIAYAAETDYSIMNPVDNVVAVSFSAQADSGLSTGVFLYDPTTPAITTAVSSAATGNGKATTTLLVASNGGVIATIATWANPAPGSLAVTSTTGFSATGGTALVVTAGPVGVAYIAYTSIDATHLLGCTFIGGTGGAATVATGANVDMGLIDAGGVTTSTGLVCNFHVLTLTGTGANGTLVPVLQHSADAHTWVDLIGGASSYAFATPTFNTVTVPAGPGACVGLVPANVTINPYLRLTLTTTIGTTFSTTFLATMARQ